MSSFSTLSTHSHWSCGADRGALTAKFQPCSSAMYIVGCNFTILFNMIQYEGPKSTTLSSACSVNEPIELTWCFWAQLTPIVWSIHIYLCGMLVLGTTSEFARTNTKWWRSYRRILAFFTYSPYGTKWLCHPPQLRVFKALRSSSRCSYSVILPHPQKHTHTTLYRHLRCLVK